MFKGMLLIVSANAAAIAIGTPAGAEPSIAGKEFLPDQYVARITAGMTGLEKMVASAWQTADQLRKDARTRGMRIEPRRPRGRSWLNR